ncbi:hypothetical protein CFBP6624_06550 [Agrobacterium tumefaciens]|uniref:Uncharacterized protein n=1 Tax=Agrobacterium tumefaciens TaxID=358 RepID=A0AAE6BJX5_AGRTU|nr:hypothetical protein CFBP6624_06550 [Agrobacterium tumefaciens]
MTGVIRLPTGFVTGDWWVEGAAHFFSPPGRRCPEGADEGASSPHISTVAPSSGAARHLLPGGEKK